MSAFKVARILCSCQTSKLSRKDVSARQHTIVWNHIIFCRFHLLQFRVEFTSIWWVITDGGSRISWTFISNKRWENSRDLCEYPQLWYSEYVNRYIATHNPWGRLKWPSASTRLTAHFIRSDVCSGDLIVWLSGVWFPLLVMCRRVGENFSIHTAYVHPAIMGAWWNEKLENCKWH